MPMLDDNQDVQPEISKKTDSRDAVESAIDLSKGDRTITWESSALKRLRKLRQWEAKNKASTVEV